VKLVPVFAALAIAAIACGSPVHAARFHACVRSSHAAHLEKTASSGPRSAGDSQSATDPATDPDQDSLGSEREAPEGLPVIDGAGLDAPCARRVQHRTMLVGDAVSRAILPAVQPPRG